MGGRCLGYRKARLHEATDYPMHQEAGYDADQHVPQELIQRDILSGRSRLNDSKNPFEKQAGS